ncbi:hypothetical protein G5714_024674 [Onychostoma macrolepis]|uniref:Uncharacterized protein n=1 Tax=Onychostoma macrolepis TaxID=369639 RepID=A0A7J6BJ27_9TELE|nr:hypothetical protein G5714_024674 [Onychostoma macrolepis]
MATRSRRARRLISLQWGQSDPPSAASAWARPRQKTHDSWPSEDSIGSAQERQSRVIFASEAHLNTAGEEKACPLQRVDHGKNLLHLLPGHICVFQILGPFGAPGDQHPTALRSFSTVFGSVEN